MRARADSRRTIAVLARILSDQGHELLDGLSGNRRIDCKDLHRDRPDRYCIEACHGIIRDSVVETWVRSEADRIDKKDRIAVRRRLRCTARSDIAAGARHILDVKLLSQTIR